MSTIVASAASDKNIRYDRQLRLWGKHGQAGLENSNLGVLYGSATSAEVLKNLVLPGIGSFTIIDDANVTAADLGNNFFVDAESLGKNRAETVASLLKEMNPFVNGSFNNQSPTSLIDEQLEYFANFTMVIADSLPQPQLEKLAPFLWEKKIPLVLVRSYGFIGYIRLIVPEHGIVESHPPEQPDLRLIESWPELDQYVDSVDLELSALEEKERVKAHSHIPWLVLVHRFMRKYKEENGTDCPRNVFKGYMMEQRVTKSTTGGKYVEENFDEAARNSWRAFSKHRIPSTVSALFKDPAASVTSESSEFWFLVAALRDFVSNEGGGTQLPLPGSLPDMHASSQNYLALQRVFNQKFEADVAAITAHLQKLGAPEIDAEVVQRFVKNAKNLRLIRYRNYNEAANSEDLNERLRDDDDGSNANVAWWIVLRAVANFQAKHVRYPGQADADVPGDIPLLKAEVDAFVKEAGIDIPSTIQIDDKIAEAVRYGGAVLHNIAAFLGGVASLEVIKLASAQWVPLNNTFIFNGINGTSISFEP